MYFAQEYISLGGAVVVSAGVALLIIGVRATTLIGAKLAFFGVIVPAAAILALTLGAAVAPRLQGLLLTIEAIAFFVIAMMLVPKIKPEATMPVPAGSAAIVPEPEAR